MTVRRVIQAALVAAWLNYADLLRDERGGGPTPFVNSFKPVPTGSFRYNTSQYGTVLPIAYGCQRCAVNLLEFWNFTGGSGKGGKGGGGKAGGGKKQASYSVFVAMAICQGPAAFTGAPLGIGGNNRIWSNGGISAGPPSNVGLNGFAGNDGQAPDSVFLTEDPNTPVIGYSGICYVTGDPLQLGNTPALPNISFEMTGFEAGTIGPDFPGDANPALIVEDLLTNSRYGAGFPSANLDSSGTFADFANYCQAAELAMSLLLDRPQPAAQWLADIAEATVAAVVWSAGLLKVIPYATGSFSNNGASWSPSTLSPIYSLGDSDFIDWTGGARSSSDTGTDPVVVNRNDPAALTNWLSIEYLDSSNSYNPNIAYTFDQGAIDSYGLRSEPSKSGHFFTNAPAATISAQLQLNRKQAVRDTFKFQLGWRYCLLEPMDVVELTDIGAGLSGLPVRITAIEETENGELQVTAEDLPNVASAAPPIYPAQAPSGAPLPLFENPGNANAPIIFEPPEGLTGGALVVWILSSGGANWGGANVWVSTDGASYTNIGAIFAGARQGTLTATLPSYGGANPDNADTLSVDLTQSEGQLVSGSSGDAASFVTLCYCDGELLSYQTATLTSSFKYNLTTLYRGVYGTPIRSHSSGSLFAYLGLQETAAGLLKYQYPSNLIGQTIQVKLQSFNRFGGGLQSLAGLTPASYVLTGEGAVQPVNIPFSFAGNPIAGSAILNYTFGENDNFPANLLGSIATCGNNATVTTIFDLAKNGTNFATLTYTAATSTASFSGSAESFSTGDILTITPRRTDATLANLTGNLAGST